MEKQVNAEDTPSRREVKEAQTKAAGLFKSAGEAFGLARIYKGPEQEEACFSDDQAKMLLALEKTVESFKIHYASPYDDEEDWSWYMCYRIFEEMNIFVTEVQVSIRAYSPDKEESGSQKRNVK